jgi:type III secretion system YscQ/HrcQ family protein
MNVTPFDLGACPAVNARRAHATRAALPAFAMLPERWDVGLPPFGAAAISPVGIDGDERHGDEVELALRFGAGPGRLAVYPVFAAPLVDRVVGGRGTPPAVVRPLGPTERGVLAGVLAPIWDDLGCVIDLGVVPARNRDVAAVVLRIETSSLSGSVRVTPASGGGFASERREPVWRAHAGRLPVAARVEIARTGLGYRELAGIAPGDAIVFDGVGAAAFAARASWPGRLVVGAFAAELTVGAGGELVVAGGFFREQRDEREEMVMAAVDSKVGSRMDPTTDRAMDPTTDRTTDATEVLASAPVEVVAELGRITLRGDELLGLTAGAVLALGRGRQNVSLCVAGQVWADGEIVDVDGQLGVRVTRVARR